MTTAAVERSFILACFLLAFLIFALFFAWVLLNHDYEAWYLGLGNLLLQGELDLYQDEMTGQWVPLPFYVYGLSQIVFGPSLLAARLVSIAIGLGIVTLIFLLASRWGGPVAGAVASGLFCTNGLVMGYFATAHFSPLVAVLHLIGIYVLFCTEWRRQDLIAMAVFSVLFLVKPHYWPAIPFLLLFLLWRASSLRARLALVAAALAIPALFFAWDPRHLKMLAFVPVLRDWVEPLGFRSLHSLHEDPAAVWASDYVGIQWATTPWGQVIRVLQAFGFLLKRYAVWMAALLALGGLAIVQTVRQRAPSDLWRQQGPQFTFWLFCYLAAWQFVVVGPYIKQAFAYLGAISPLLAVVIGYLFSIVWRDLELPRPLRAVAAVSIVMALVLSPWVHRSHWLPRTVTVADAAIPTLQRLSGRLAGLIPAGEKNVFLLADPLPLHLAGRQAYLRQFHQHYMAFTSVRERARYARTGMWGPAEIEQWLGAEAQYAIIEPKVLDYYRGRTPYREPVPRIDFLLNQNFVLMDTLRGHDGDLFKVYRRKGLTVEAR